MKLAFHAPSAALGATCTLACAVLLSMQSTTKIHAQPVALLTAKQVEILSFFMLNEIGELGARFHRDSDGAVTGFTLDVSGRESEATKVDSK